MICARSAPATCLLATLAALACACGDKGSETGAVGDSAADSGSSGGAAVTWTPAFDTSGAGSLSGVWGTGPADVWVVGGDDEAGEAWHYDGSSWSETPLPDGTPLLVWVYGFSPSDVFAVGLDGAAVHWDGAAWTALETGTTEDLWGVFGFTNDDLWVVGGDADVGDPLILHWDGTAFTEDVLPAEQNPRGATTLFKVWGAEGALWLVGQKGTLLAREADGWVFQSGGAQANQDFVSLDGWSARDVVVVGGRGNARVSNWDGGGWTTLAPSGIGGLNAVAVQDDGTVVVGGIGGFAGIFDPATGTVQLEELLGQEDLHAAWNDGAGTTYMVGGTFAAPHRGAAWARTTGGAP
ncbi:MAG: hypothetical protein VX265_00050 [Myxococcota bacterium]|nr:hypothetical protein [Myxococcota bacterium]